MNIDAEWILKVKEFLALITYHHADHDLEEYNERQLWREKEFADHETGIQRNNFVKQVLSPYFHTLQKNALKQLNADDKQKVLGLVNQLR